MTEQPTDDTATDDTATDDAVTDPPSGEVEPWVKELAEAQPGKGVPPTTDAPEETRELLGVAHEMVRAIDDLRKEMSGTKQYGRRNRQLIRWIVISLLVDVVLSAGLGFAVLRANAATRRAEQASSRAEQASSAQVVACRAGNEARALQTQLWNTILAYPPGIGETLAQAKQREERVIEFRRYIAEAFAQQDCSKP